MKYGYIRVSKDEQQGEHQKHAILKYAQTQGWVIDEFIEVEITSRKDMKARRIEELIEKLREEDMLIISEITRLGRSLGEIIKIVQTLIAKKVYFYSLKENIVIEGEHTMQSKIMVANFGIFGEIERDLISMRTKEALANKKAQGVKLGRPKGAGKSKLDEKAEEIKVLLGKGVSLSSVAKIMDVAYTTMFYFCRRYKLR